MMPTVEFIEKSIYFTGKNSVGLHAISNTEGVFSRNCCAHLEPASLGINISNCYFRNNPDAPSDFFVPEAYKINIYHDGPLFNEIANTTSLLDCEKAYLGSYMVYNDKISGGMSSTIFRPSCTWSSKEKALDIYVNTFFPNFVTCNENDKARIKLTLDYIFPPTITLQSTLKVWNFSRYDDVNYDSTLSFNEQQDISYIVNTSLQNPIPLPKAYMRFQGDGIGVLYRVSNEFGYDHCWATIEPVKGGKLINLGSSQTIT